MGWRCAAGPAGSTAARQPAAAPGALPLLGHAWPLLRHRLAFLESLRQYGAVVPIRLGPSRAYVVNDPALVREVLTRRAAEFGLSPQFKVMRRIIGNGLLATDGPFHRAQRKLILPAFQHAKIAGYAAAMSTLTRARLEGWRSGRVVDLEKEFSELATEIAVRCLFSAGVDQRGVDEVVAALPQLMAWAGSRGLDPSGLLARLPTPLNRRFRRAMAGLDLLLGDIVAGRQAEGRGAEGQDQVGADDLLSMLLAARYADTGRPMAAQQVHDEAMSFLVAGTESVSRTLAWSVHLLSRAPEVAARLRAEVDAQLGCRMAGFEDLDRLPYTRMVLHEALRLYPPGYLISRAAKVATELGGCRVPAGGVVMFSYYALQRDPAAFPDPARFDPERWREGGPPGAGREAFLPFGLGAHGCLGEGFAWCELTIVLASLAARWEFEPLTPGPVEPIPTFSLTLDGLPVRLRERTPAGGPITGQATDPRAVGLTAEP
ncbi:Cytochrome P450 [Kitasatospora sp. MMS16-BH015]|uniref:cytochrome P450 n=1 Tax=Kitasatospora sp. MMS16-BH015 TaxID=2018025 RepID=UPI000CA2BFD8|nr:cytochrome P450 [Kitasatospora sp. MMS16-BH015]AUG80716.1 Cytochrome P450 [Kitasatospora sp. MMS16-BH015]